MKKFLVLLLILSSCKKEVFYYPSEDFFKENNPKEILIDDLSFKEVTESIRNGLHRKKKYFITIEESDKIYYIIPFADTDAYVKIKDNDSIYISIDKFPLHKMSNFMKSYYETKIKEYYRTNFFKTPYIELIIEPINDTEKISKLLLKAIKTSTFNKDSSNLHILLHYNLVNPPIPIKIED